MIFVPRPARSSAHDTGGRVLTNRRSTNVCASKNELREREGWHGQTAVAEKKDLFSSLPSATATPYGEITLGVMNPAALAQFEQGKEYYVDFIPAR